MVVLVVRRFLPDQDDQDAAGSRRRRCRRPGRQPGPAPLAAWREPRTLLIGVFVLAFAFAEGAGNDWISVAMIDGYGPPAAVGTLAFAALPGRDDRRPVVRPGAARPVRPGPGACATLAAVAVVGLLLFVFGAGRAAGLRRRAAVGAGHLARLPGRHERRRRRPDAAAAARVSVVASIGYCAFLGGPPLIGFLGDQLSVLRALTAVAVLLGVAALTSAAVREPARRRPDPARQDPDPDSARPGPQPTRR